MLSVMKNGLLYEKISEDIRQSIDKGRLSPGAKIPSVNELRQGYGVSHITALRVYKELSDGNYIVQQKGKGYFVRDRFFKKTVMTGVLGCFIRPLRDFRMDDNYFNDINYGIQSECCIKRINLLRPHALGVLHQYLPSEEGLSEIKRAMLNMVDTVDGFLVDERIPDSLIADIISKTGKPAIVVNRRSSLAVDTVGPDNRHGVLDALGKVSRMGYNRFMFCSSGVKDSCLLDRLEAFKEFIRQNNIDDSHAGIVGDCSIIPLDESLAAIKKIYNEKSVDDKTLIMAETDSIARNLTEFFTEIDITPGKDIGILGFGGLGFANNFKPQLSTVDINPAGIGAMAVNVLMSRISSDQYLKPAYNCPEPIFSFGETI